MNSPFVGSNGVTAGWPSGGGSFASGLCASGLSIGGSNTGDAAAVCVFSLSVVVIDDFFGCLRRCRAAGCSEIGPVSAMIRAFASFN